MSERYLKSREQDTGFGNPFEFRKSVRENIFREKKVHHWGVNETVVFLLL